MTQILRNIAKRLTASTKIAAATDLNGAMAHIKKVFSAFPQIRTKVTQGGDNEIQLECSTSMFTLTLFMEPMGKDIDCETQVDFKGSVWDKEDAVDLQMDLEEAFGDAMGGLKEVLDSVEEAAMIAQKECKYPRDIGFSEAQASKLVNDLLVLRRAFEKLHSTMK